MPLERTDGLKYSDYVRGRLWEDVAEGEGEGRETYAKELRNREERMAEGIDGSI